MIDRGKQAKEAIVEVKSSRRCKRKGERKTEASTVVKLATGASNGAGPMFTPFDIVCPTIISKCMIGTLVYLLHA